MKHQVEVWSYTSQWLATGLLVLVLMVSISEKGSRSGAVKSRKYCQEPVRQEPSITGHSNKEERRANRNQWRSPGEEWLDPLELVILRSPDCVIIDANFKVP